MKRQFDADGYYVIPQSKAYPGLVARRLASGRELVCSGPPELARKAVDEEAARIEAETETTIEALPALPNGSDGAL